MSLHYIRTSTVPTTALLVDQNEVVNAMKMFVKNGQRWKHFFIIMLEELKAKVQPRSSDTHCI